MRDDVRTDTIQPYRAPAWLVGSHAQTIWPYLLRGPQVAFRRERIGIAGLLVDAGEQYQFVQALERPAVFHERRGEVVQQLGLCGRLAAFPES